MRLGYVEVINTTDFEIPKRALNRQVWDFEVMCEPAPTDRPLTYERPAIKLRLACLTFQYRTRDDSDEWITRSFTANRDAWALGIDRPVIPDAVLETAIERASSAELVWSGNA